MFFRETIYGQVNTTTQRPKKGVKKSVRQKDKGLTCRYRHIDYSEKQFILYNFLV